MGRHPDRFILCPTEDTIGNCKLGTIPPLNKEDICQTHIDEHFTLKENVLSWVPRDSKSARMPGYSDSVAF
jgi:hypothetical protein